MNTKIISLLIAGFIISAFQCFSQSPKKNLTQPGDRGWIDSRIDNMQYWTKKAQEGVIPFNPQVTNPPAIFKGTHLRVKGVKNNDSPDVPVSNLTNITESENSIFVDPNNAEYILNSNNSTSWSGSSVGTLYGACYFQSANAGSTWGGSPQGAGGGNSGDPTTAISLSGRQYVNYIDNSYGQGIAYSDDGNNWSTTLVAPNPGYLADKNHMWIDNRPTSPYVGNLYVAWTDFDGPDDTEIKIVRSTTNGTSWSTPLNISSAVNAGSHNQGVNIQTGPAGQVYVVWSIYDGWPTDESALGFAKSTDGGATYGAATRILTNIKGIRNTTAGKNHRVNSFPSMAVDISGGIYDGNIYVVWTNVGVPGTNTGTNKSVYMIRSSDGGTVWSTPVRVNQGTFTDGKAAYFPWITCDPETGTLAVVFYDDRDVSSSQCETWVAYSMDAGATWTDFRVSDVAFTPSAIPGLAGGYMGDYLGITSKGGMVYPCWTDNRGGLYMTYVSPFTLGLNASFSATGTLICTGSTVTYTSTSTGPPTSWIWSFPGGSPSSYIGQTPPPVTYATSGTYDVSLIVSDGIDSDTLVKTGFVTVKDLIANFSGTPTTVVIGNTVSFTDNSSCSPATWEWTFPGGTPASHSGQTPPAILYPALGTYDVSLTITKPGFSDTKTKTAYITVTPPIFNMGNETITTCTGDFYDSGGSTGSYNNNENFTMTFIPNAPNSMVKMTFTTFSTESGYDYLRIYNGTSTASPLIGTYNGTTGPGTVTATNASGALTFNFTSDVSVVSTGWAASISCMSTTEPPVAQFTASSVTPPINTTVTFTDQSTNIPTSWLWGFSPSSVTFTGGTSATSQNPQVQFLEVGAYNVTLTATNQNGFNTLTKAGYINTTPCAHCTSTSNNATMEWISNVTLNTINNTSAGSVGYENFTSISTNLTPGSSYPLSITCNQTGSWTEHIWAFADWNQDCDFTDAGESYDLGEVSAPGTLTITMAVPEGAAAGATRFRASLKYSSDPTSCETFTYGQVEDYTVSVQPPFITSDLHIKVFLEGLYAGNSSMRQAYDGSGPHFGTGIADQVTVELHSNSNYGAIVSTFHNVSISTSGDIVINGITTIPGTSYYVTVKHRNSIETTTAQPIVFSGGTVNYDFTTSSSAAFGNNLLNQNGVYLIYSGDVNQDGSINSTDMNMIETAASSFSGGYIPADIDGNAIIDFSDMVPVEMNIILGIHTMHP